MIICDYLWNNAVNFDLFYFCELKSTKGEIGALNPASHRLL